MTKPVTGQTTFGANTTGTTTQLDNNFLLAYTALNDFNTYSNYLVDNGAANAYAVSLAANLTGSLAAGLIVQFKATNVNTGASTFAFNGTAAKNILNPNGSSLSAGQIPANAIVQVQYDGTQYQLLGGSGVGFSQLTNSLSGDVALNNIGNYFTGPSVSQGNVGVWFASGTVTINDGTTTNQCFLKLWDGTTVIASCQMSTLGTLVPVSASLSGYISAPAGNIRISVRASSTTTGVILFNATGNSKDSTITALRIA